jgi:hypothetical protein
MRSEITLRVIGTTITVILILIIAIAVAIAILRISEGHIGKPLIVWVVDGPQLIEEKVTLDFFCEVSLIPLIQEN